MYCSYCHLSLRGFPVSGPAGLIRICESPANQAAYHFASTAAQSIRGATVTISSSYSFSAVSSCFLTRVRVALPSSMATSGTLVRSAALRAGALRGQGVKSTIKLKSRLFEAHGLSIVSSLHSEVSSFLLGSHSFNIMAVCVFQSA